jgi:hypothetical protein
MDLEMDAREYIVWDVASIFFSMLAQPKLSSHRISPFLAKVTEIERV